MPHEKSLKYAWEPRNDDWFCPPPSIVLKIFDHWGDVLICLLINTSAPSHWLKSVAWPVGPVLKFRDIPDCLSTTKPQNVNIMETAGFHSFIGLFRFTITFSRCPHIARARLSGQRLYKTKYALQMVLNWQVNKSQVSTHISLLDLFRQHFCHEIRWKPAVLYLHVKQMQ